MEMKSARRIGGGIAVQTLLFGVVLFEVYQLVTETRGDFANGLLFFLAGQLNPFVLGAFAILFTTTYFCGRGAGMEILIELRHFVWVGLKYALLVMVVMSGSWVGVYVGMHAPREVWRILPVELVVMSIALGATWLWAGWRIRRKARSL
jgi:hypothetical protein